jgi:hypothetical protein
MFVRAIPFKSIWEGECHFFLFFCWLWGWNHIFLCWVGIQWLENSVDDGGGYLSWLPFALNSLAFHRNTTGLFRLATRQQNLRLPSLRVDNSTSRKITHYCFGANSGKMVRSLKRTKRIYLFISDGNLRFCCRVAILNNPVVIFHSIDRFTEGGENRRQKGLELFELPCGWKK